MPGFAAVRRFRWPLLLGMSALATTPPAAEAENKPAAEVRLMTLDPGHFHAALIQKDMYPAVSETVHVYAPLGPDLVAHLLRVSGFNHRAERPTSWRLEVHTQPDFFERMLREKPGNVVVLSGRNRGKIDRILACVQAGLNVLADKPWVIDPADLPKLEAALDTAERSGLVAYDVMTERYEITTRLQRELVQDAAVFGSVVPGTDAEPGISMKSVHHVLKTVAGAPNLRPAWFFDANEQGEALADVGTHLVDLVPWILFPGQPLDRTRDIRLVAARGWPTVLTKADFGRVTAEPGFPPPLSPWVKDEQLQFPGNSSVSYVVKGIHARLEALWNYEAPAGAGDTHHAVVRGSRARIEVRQGPEEKYRTEVYVVPVDAGQEAAVGAALRERVVRLQAELPGLAVTDADDGFRLVIPDRYRTDHESHFAQVTSRFLEYLKDPKSMPRWERANMLAKYFVTTGGVDLSRRAAR
jgi:predicted dehydrogenase